MFKKESIKIDLVGKNEEEENSYKFSYFDGEDWVEIDDPGVEIDNLDLWFGLLDALDVLFDSINF
jgi:hypothetical protein